MECLQLKTIITSIKFYDDYLFTGCGSQLLVYQLIIHDWRQIFSFKALLDQNIHGIIIKDLSRILVFGWKRLATFSFIADSQKIKQSCDVFCEDWIMDGKWLSDNTFCVLTAHSKLLLFSVNNPAPEKYITCSNRCINYCGTIVYDNWENLILLGGTVYNDIIVWSNRGTVLHELKGHKGVIFSLTCNVELGLILSTSDDRTACVWQIQWKDDPDKINDSVVKNCEITSGDNGNERKNLDTWSEASIPLKLTVWGHTARVWSSAIIDSSHFATVGEDGMAIVWNRTDGKACWSSVGNNIGATAISCKGDKICVGGTDSSVVVHQWASSSYLLTPTLLPSPSTVTRKVVLSPSGQIVVCSDNGSILLWNETWNEVYSSCNLQSYCVCSPSPSRTFLALASITGSVHILKFAENGVIPCFCQTLIEGRIFSLHWLNDTQFLISGANGEMTLWNLSYTTAGECSNLKLTHRLVLPESKERWPTCADINGKLLLVGDRQGSIILYDMDKSSEECVGIVRGVHRGRGASCVRWSSSDTAVSCGRDGTLRRFHYESLLTLVSTTRLCVDWPANIVTTQRMGPLLLAFHNVYAEVIALEDMRAVLRIKCGGGHRSWDWILFPDSTELRIVFISNKKIHYVSAELKCPVYLRDSFHGRTINGGLLVRKDDKITVVTGGEDCSLRSMTLEGTNSSKGWHLSSVRSVTYLLIDSSIFLFSAGGRQQIKAWSLSSDGSLSEVACSRNEKKEKSGEAIDSGETRYMEIRVKADTSGSLASIYIASSDGSFRIYAFLKKNKGYIIQFERLVILDSCLLSLAMSSKLIFSGSTSGFVTVLNAHQELIEKTSVHCGGVNVISVSEVGDYIAAATGGDDTSVVLSIFDRNGKFCTSAVLRHHTAQVTGIAMFRGQWIFSVGGDQVLAIWKWTFCEEIKFHLVRSMFTVIADAHGLSVCPHTLNDSVILMIYGVGIEVLKVNLNELDSS